MGKVKDARAKYAVDEKTYTPAEYLARERAAEFKSEYYDGKIVMMAGGTMNHSLISGNVHTLLNNALDSKPCMVFNSDNRLQLKRKEGYVYPDVVVVCGKPEFMDAREDTLTNPTVVVEVLSHSTKPKNLPSTNNWIHCKRTSWWTPTRSTSGASSVTRTEKCGTSKLPTR